MSRIAMAYYDAFKAALAPLGIAVTFEQAGRHHPFARCRTPAGVERIKPIACSPKDRDPKVARNLARQDARKMARLLGVA